MKAFKYLLFLGITLVMFSCGKKIYEVHDPDTAEIAVIDRFSASAGTLHVRTSENNYPAAGDAIDFDQPPFINKGLGPNGELVTYYDFDVMPLTAAPIYVLFKQGEDDPVEGQLNIIDVIPGDENYSDFWHMYKVTVPDDYEANTVSSFEEIVDFGFPITPSTYVINCPVVPQGSTATLRYREEESNALDRGWYKKKVVYYFTFEEKELSVIPTAEGIAYMPISGIYVTFNINPDEDGGGPPSGFVTETGTRQTHNVLETIPEDNAYSPLWSVNVYDNADFEIVSDWTSANDANSLARGVMLVNCPVILVETSR